MAIGATAHKLILDTTQFVDGAMLSRKEMGFLKTVLRETATDADHLAAGMEQLTSLLNKGALTTDQYEKAVAKLNSELNEQDDNVKKADLSLVDLVAKLNLAERAADLVRKAFAAVSDAAKEAAEQIGQQWEKTEQLINAAANLDIATSAFQNIVGAAAQADIEIGSVQKALEKMLVAISKEDSKKFAEAFQMLGLDAEKLATMGADEAMQRILQALEGIGNQADRVRLATQIFGDPDVLRMSSEAIADAADNLELFGGHIRDVDVANFERMDEAFTTINASIDSMWKRMANDLTPVMADLGEAFITLSEDMAKATPTDKTNSSWQKFVDTLRGVSLTLKDIAEEASSPGLMSLIGGVAAQQLVGGPGQAAALGWATNLSRQKGEQQRLSDELDAKLKSIVEKNLKTGKAAAAEIATEEGPTSFGLAGGEIDRETYRKVTAWKEEAKATRALGKEIKEINELHADSIDVKKQYSVEAFRAVDLARQEAAFARERGGSGIRSAVAPGETVAPADAAGVQRAQLTVLEKIEVNTRTAFSVTEVTL